MATRERYIEHVTLTTGHTRRSPRSEVSDEVVAMLRPLLDRALRGEHVAIPGAVPACTMTGGVHGRCCAVTVWSQDPVSGGTARPQPVPIATVGVAEHSRCGAYLWRHLHETAQPPQQLATRPDQVPPEPWCAARLEVGAALVPEAMEWLGDLERCIAWTWLEILSGRETDR